MGAASDNMLHELISLVWMSKEFLGWEEDLALVQSEDEG